MQQLTSDNYVNTGNRPRRRDLQTVAVWTAVILTLCIVTSLIALVILDRATAPWAQESELRSIRIQSQIEREKAAAQARLIGAVAWQWTINLLQVAVPVVAAALLTWIVIRRFSIVHADHAGAYPLFWLLRVELHIPRRYTDEEGKTHWLPLATFRARIIDPNRNPGMGFELGEQVTTVQVNSVSDAQMRVTSQAQAVQLERAHASGATVMQANGRRGNQQQMLIPGGHLYRPIPEPHLLSVDGSHIERLLVAQGEAEPSIIDVTPTRPDENQRG